jgi:hypothetical protein
VRIVALLEARVITRALDYRHAIAALAAILLLSWWKPSPDDRNGH